MICNLLQRTLVVVALGVGLAVTVRPARGQAGDPYAAARLEMTQLVAEGVRDRRVLESVGKTPRHLFVAPNQRKDAYHDMALPIGAGATISPPHVVAFMTEQLQPQPTDKVLEIGTGSGYQAAILSPLVAEVYSIEIIDVLGRTAAQRLQRLGYENVHVKVGDGFLGWPEHAPFDKIVVTCSPEDIPQPLIEQLKVGGKMVIPLGERFQQSLCLVTKLPNGMLAREVLESTFFIPMTGRAEELREVKEDDGIPQIANGSFEELTALNVPTGWYYLRQAQVTTDSSAPEGRHVLVMTNRTPGRTAQTLQAIGVDGRRVSEIELSAAIRFQNIPSLATRLAFAGMDIRFYDERRARVLETRVGPWRGSSSWTTVSTTIRVPTQARLAVISIGLFGVPGELALDQVAVQSKRTEQR